MKETPGADLLSAVISLNWRNNPKSEKTTPISPPPTPNMLHPPNRFMFEYVEQTSMWGSLHKY